MVRIEKEYIFAGPKGEMSLLDLFEGRRQLILYHFMVSVPKCFQTNGAYSGCSVIPRAGSAQGTLRTLTRIK